MQHFPLSATARTLSLKKVFRMGEDVAYQTFCQMRWPETEGEAVCPRCGCYESYNIVTRRKFKCVACHHQFSVTSGTIFASRKLSFTDLLAAIVIFVNGAKGVSALQVSRDLDVQYKTAFVLSHKLREAMAREMADATLNGTVEIDGAYFGGYVKPENVKSDRKDRRLSENRTGRRQCVVIMRERGGKSLPFVVAHEGDAVPYVRDHVGTLATIHADEGSGCTNETYVGLFNRTAAELKKDKALAKNASLRNALSTGDLVKVAFSEVLSVERMEAEDSQGFNQCRMATRVAASSVKRALEANKQDSQPRLIG